MAISSLLHNQYPSFCSYRRSKLSAKSIACSSLKTQDCKPAAQRSSLSRDDKLSWKEELKKAYQREIPNLNWDKLEELEDESFQNLVDKRCVDNVRMLIVDSVQNAKAGHPGMALGMAGVLFLLYRHVMKYNPKNPKWFNRDRFVLSAGHGCLLQYVCLHLAGFESVQVCELFFCSVQRMSYVCSNSRERIVRKAEFSYCLLVIH
ncbi:uncharacterized protein LOC120288707 [Eucalyptus grandis]|uniref:uncharacterized protein LOC120288707 n=1 Tax=Eucalyptus grandis TaxID=71139 RepID=UPI00192EFDD2|nr:uncharacterized protein LOC120288707 [Eucalyptus grandis]